MKLYCVFVPVAIASLLGSLLKCPDGSYSLNCPSEPPPRCLVWSPNQKDCVDLPKQARPEADIDKMISDFNKSKWDRNHY